MDERNPSSLRLISTLSMTGLVSGLILVGVFLATRPAIERNQAEALERAIFRVLPGAAGIEPMTLAGDALQPWRGVGRPPADGTIYAGLDESGRLVGWAIPAGGAGFMDTIRLIYGYEPASGLVVGMRVLDSRETPGLGDKIVHDEVFLANFEALAIEPAIEGTKKGRTRPNEVDTITGATISSEAVIAILNRSAERWVPVIDRTDAARDGGGDDGR